MLMTDAGAFAELFRNHITISEQTLELLRLERASLEENRLDDFKAITDKKAGVLDALAQADIEIFTRLQEAGCAGSAVGIQEYLASLDPTAAHRLQPLWDEIMELTRQCQHANLVNGTMIEACKKEAEQMLDILLGRSQKVELYSSSGKAVRNTPHNSIKA
ncbi:MAG: flagellar protein FlgN [Pseudomonadota bacterium]